MSAAAIASMVSGVLHKDAEAKISAGGKSYIALVVRTAGEQAQFVRVSLWGDDCEGAMSLGKGDAVSVVGALTVGVWEANGKASPSLNMMAHRCISPSIKRPRKPQQRHAASQPTQSSFRAAAEAQAIRPVGELKDDLPWDA